MKNHIWSSQSPCIIIRIKYINQQDATVSQVYYLTCMCGSTCFGSLSAHHQERTTALRASGFTVGAWRLERCWSWPGRPQPTTFQPSRGGGKSNSNTDVEFDTKLSFGLLKNLTIFRRESVVRSGPVLHNQRDLHKLNSWQIAAMPNLFVRGFPVATSCWENVPCLWQHTIALLTVVETV